MIVDCLGRDPEQTGSICPNTGNGELAASPVLPECLISGNLCSQPAFHSTLLIYCLSATNPPLGGQMMDFMKNLLLRLKEEIEISLKALTS